MKEYRSRWDMYATDVTVDGHRKHISFTSLRHGGSYYIASEKNEISAIEKIPDFGNQFYLYEVLSDPKPSAPSNAEPVIEKKEVESVTNITEAREYLKKDGVDHRKLLTPASVLKQAETLGVGFPNLIM